MLHPIRLLRAYLYLFEESRFRNKLDFEFEEAQAAILAWKALLNTLN